MLNNHLLIKLAKCSTVEFKQPTFYIGYTNRYYQIWFSLNNSKSLAKSKVSAKRKTNKTLGCQLTKSLVSYAHGEKKNIFTISTLKNQITSYRCIQIKFKSNMKNCFQVALDLDQWLVAFYSFLLRRFQDQMQAQGVKHVVISS